MSIEVKVSRSYAAAFTVVGIALNLVLGTLARMTGIPGLYLDLGGTMIVGLLLGPWWAAGTGLLTNVLLSITGDPVALPFGAVNLLVGVTVGYMSWYGWTKSWPKFIVTFILTALITSLSASLIVTFLFGGATGAPQDILVFVLLSATGWDIFGGVFVADIVGKPIDHAITWAVVFAIMRALPGEFRLRTPFAPKAR